MSAAVNLRQAMAAVARGDEPPSVVVDMNKRIIGCALDCRTVEETEALYAQLLTYLKRVKRCGTCGQVEVEA